MRAESEGIETGYIQPERNRTFGRQAGHNLCETERVQNLREETEAGHNLCETERVQNQREEGQDTTCVKQQAQPV